MLGSPRPFPQLSAGVLPVVHELCPTRADVLGAALTCQSVLVGAIE
jgi:hypothetical protein